MSEPILVVDNLHVNVGDTPILKGLSLTLEPGKIHAIMGPNGSGKSTLAHVLSGRPGYTVTSGSVTFMGQDLLELEPHERSHAGVFLAFQYPVEIPGIQNRYFLREILNAQRVANGLDPLNAVAFLKLLREKVEMVQINDELTKREVNFGFSGGEKKRNEILQMALLEPKLAILDETDSGLDIDALRTVSEGVNKLRDPNRGMIIVTHYQRLLEYIVPDVVHVLKDGRIALSGGSELALELEEKGYDWVESKPQRLVVPA